MKECDLCSLTCDHVSHLPLYVFGSEGVNACLQCRVVLTEVARGIRSATMRAKKKIYLDQKQAKKDKL